MFYSSDLLIFKKGKFSLIWLAATRGERHISKRDLNLINIHFSCAELLEYIKRKQTMKLSLYLSSQLTFGICVLYCKKIDRLLYDLQELYKKSMPLSLCVKNLTNKKKGNKKCKSNDISIRNIMEDFPSYNESFGILNDMDSTMIIKDSLINTSINQARIEDITFMEYDIVPSTLRNHLENDLEPLNAELLQELLGGTDNVQNDLEVLLQKPFHEDVVMVDLNEPDFHLSQSCRNFDVDLDNEIGNREDGNLSGNVLIETPCTKNNQIDGDQDMNNVNDRNLNLDNTSLPVKSSRAIEEIKLFSETILDETDENVKIIDLHYPIKKRSEISNKFVDFQLEKIISERKPRKRKVPNRSLLVDNVTTISHQVIRENMNKKNFCMVAKESLFPNALISRSIKAQIACSAANLFEFPGNIDIVKSHQLLSFWMKQKNICQNLKSNTFGYESTSPKDAPVLAVVDETGNELSDLSIQQLRGRESSKRTTMQIDSFTFGSDSLQKSIVQNSFDLDKPPEDVNIQIVDELPLHQTDISMLPIIEEVDVVPRQDDNQEVILPVETLNGDVGVVHELKMVDKCEVWNTIKRNFKQKFGCYSKEEDVRVSFYELCPRGSLKKNASVFFITLLRLAKYKKIRLFQDKLDSDILIGLPLIEVE